MMPHPDLWPDGLKCLDGDTSRVISRNWIVDRARVSGGFNHGRQLAGSPMNLGYYKFRPLARNQENINKLV